MKTTNGLQSKCKTGNNTDSLQRANQNMSCIYAFKLKCHANGFKLGVKLQHCERLAYYNNGTKMDAAIQQTLHWNFCECLKLYFKEDLKKVLSPLAAPSVHISV